MYTTIKVTGHNPPPLGQNPPVELERNVRCRFMLQERGFSRRCVILWVLSGLATERGILGDYVLEGLCLPISTKLHAFSQFLTTRK